MRCLVLLIISAVLLCCSGGLRADDLRIRTPPTRIKDSITPELRIRELIEDGQRRWALIATLDARHGGHLYFNPFGDYRVGRAYRVVLTDSEFNILHTVVKGSSGTATPPDRDAFMRMHGHGVIGRCHWTGVHTGTDDRNPDDLAVFPKVPAGRYPLVMLVTQRMFPEKSVEYIQLRPDMWNDPRLDEPCCASLPVVVDVDAQGDYRPVLNEGVDGRFAILESDVHVGINSDLSLTTRFVNPSEAWLVIPGLDVFTSRRGSARISVVRDDGVAFNRFTKLRGGTNHYANPIIKDSVLVPRDGVIGGTEHYAGTLKASGKYLVTTEIDESIYKDKLFVDGKRVDRELSEWPIVFRSRTTTITVPEKAP